MSAIYFPKPQPLSPKTLTKEIDGVRKQLIKGQWVNVFGVPITNSVYYYWFEYLKLSSNYKKACANNGKDYEKIYEDFGNVFDKKYDGIEGFWKWWREDERGVELFGVKAHGNNWLSLDEAMLLQSDIDKNNIKLFAVPTNITKSAVKKRFNKLLAKTDFKTAKAQSKPKYEVKSTKVDVPSLRKCLRVFEKREVEGINIFEIGCKLMFLDEAQIKELQEDGRSKKREYDLTKLWEGAEKAGKKYWKLYNKVVTRLEKKQEAERVFWDKVKKEQNELDKPKKRSREELLNNTGEFDSTKGFARVGEREEVDYLSEEHIDEAMLKEGYRASDTQRSKSKQALRTNTYRLLKKAKANIEAVEKGMFGVGH